MITCKNCDTEIESIDVFCGNCGNKIVKIDSEKESNSVRLVLFFYLAFLVYAVVAYAIYAESDSLLTEISLESVFILLTVAFSLFDAKGIAQLYNTDLIRWKNLLFAVVFPVFSALLVYFGLEYLNSFLFEGTENYFEAYVFYDNPMLWAIIFIAILPPIFEELAFRGFLFNQLQIITTPQVTIIATSVIFALVHFSFLSFLWIFPFGLVLGYLRHRYKTLWLGMLVHFIHNFIVLMLDYYYYEASLFLDF